MAVVHLLLVMQVWSATGLAPGSRARPRLHWIL